MRFMIIVKGSKETEADAAPTEQLIADMTAYHEDLAKAGVLLDGNGLHPSAKGMRIKYAGNKRTFVDGPFTEAKELIAGYTVIQAASWEEAMEWARRFPNPIGEGKEAEIEIREIRELEEFMPSEAVDRLRAIGVGGR